MTVLSKDDKAIVTVALRLPQWEADLLQQTANIMGVSRNALILQLIVEAPWVEAARKVREGGDQQ